MALVTHNPIVANLSTGLVSLAPDIAKAAAALTAGLAGLAADSAALDDRIRAARAAVTARAVATCVRAGARLEG